MRNLLRVGLVTGFLLTLPATAHAATPTITNDQGADAALGSPLTISNPTPVLKLQFNDSERRYAVKVTGPAGTDAATPVTCRDVASYQDIPVNYAGNGTYTVSVTSTTDSSDIGCAGGTNQSSQFKIELSSRVAAPDGRILIRRAGSSDLLTHTVGVTGNRGTDTEIAYARNVKPRTDGSLPGDAVKSAVVPSSAKSVDVTFDRPGRWVVVSRPVLGGGAGPWSAPVAVTAKAPFDLAAPPKFKDALGPKYKLQGDVVAAIPKGSRIKVSIATGLKKKHFKKLRTVKTRKHGVFRVPLKLTKGGAYRIRFRYKGGKTVAAGRSTSPIKVETV